MNDGLTRDIKLMEEIFADTMKNPEGVACIHLGTEEKLAALKSEIDDQIIPRRLTIIEAKLNLLLVHLKVDCPGMIITVPNLPTAEAAQASLEDRDESRS